MITFDEKTKIFHLKNSEISYVMGVLRTGHLAHYHFGERLEGELIEAYFRTDQNKGLTAYVEEGRFDVSLGLERLEYPSFGTGDFREPAVDVLRTCGSRLTDFKYESYQVSRGKPAIEGLPHSWCENEDEVETLIIKLIDNHARLEVYLSYSLFENLGIIARSAKIVNVGDSPVVLDRLMSMSIDLVDSKYHMCHLAGDWISERQLYETKLRPGNQSIGSKRGASSAQHNPFMMLKRSDTSESSGEVFGISLIYSGNFLMAAEVDSQHQTRLSAGIHPDGFSWSLVPGDSFTSPEALLCHTCKGVGHMSRTFHRFFREYLIPKKWRASVRPVLVNNWEATYFDFDEKKLLKLAEKSKALGVDLFVLDDGWFGKRNDDTTGLGDWYVNKAKLPDGIKGISEKIRALGMDFGLWIEPEMINMGTRLFDDHPEWVLGEPGRSRAQARNQYVLDYSNPQVVDHIFSVLSQILDGSLISYIKWDMNRNITDAFSSYLSGSHQGELMHRYILGVYELYGRIRSRYPDVMIESCAAGGGRFDPGMLFYAPQAWTSDNTDALERMNIQYATSLVYPLSMMGSHVSEVPNHQVMRSTPLKTRADVAYFGTFGYELDFNKMDEGQCAQVVDQINFFKTYRTLIHLGDFYRLISPFEGDKNETAWMVVSEGKESAIVAWYQKLARSNACVMYMKLEGLDEHAVYKVNDEMPVHGSILMNIGIKLIPSFNGITKTEDSTGDYQSRIWTLKKIT
ncbi:MULTISPECIES: alpha-galactosidase [unclassified Fusibacter]|uniref:alpha-galactosidase n=1 Tax=unclassified Fusibacter TaxID=2624464 RepID=UPI001012B822|nr:MULTISPECIES: alpha-galactosidase [unclassified Fusibacter]MCK8060078.1 alpha-galactosidase [Fusibacter sp. A2]NPE22220.1 alpha-galactosidase [Fusibacter sp. A1]RXV60994.1 alpha-galactosidase [Fusibacter sp. A1]